MTDPSDPLTTLCLACGLCCDGTLFKDVELQAGDRAENLQSLGLPVKEGKFPQPCSALGGDKCCRVYADRPARCRQFECALYLSVKGGRMQLPAALEEVTHARRLADKVRRLLRQLGDERDTPALSLRFQEMKRAMEPRGLDDDSAESFAELTLTVNELTRTLNARFYP